ncbi:metallophosphoesterase [Longispora urticae]
MEHTHGHAGALRDGWSTPPSSIRPPGPLFAVSDVHGFLPELIEALFAAALVDRAGRWTGGAARLWFLGDYVDRGPDGIGVIDYVRRLQGEAGAAGGHVGALLGNHEIQLLGADRFADSPVPGWGYAGGLHDTWLQWGGRAGDLRRLTDEHRAWLYGLPAAAVVGEHLLVHSDSLGYLRFGSTLTEVNERVAEAMTTEDAGVWLDLTLAFVDRLAFQGGSGPAAVDRMLAALGGRAIVHGHSTLIRHFGVAAGQVRGPVVYAGGRVTAVDGGVHEGGRVLVVPLSTRSSA